MTVSWRALLDALRRLLRAVLRGALFVLQMLAALVLLFEEWGWRPLVELLGVIARWRPLARLEFVIAGLPSWPALLVFAAPSLLLFPVKIAGLWLLAKGKVLAAGLLLAAAKVVSTALVARIFMFTKPALMRLAWFAWVYDRFMPWKEALFAWIRASWIWRYGRMLKSAIKRAARLAWKAWRPTLMGWRDSIITRARQISAEIRIGMRRLWNEIRSRLGA